MDKNGEKNVPQELALTKIKVSTLRSAVNNALSTDGKKLRFIAKKMNLKPETLLTRIEKALPSMVEQYMYLRLSSDFRIHPETLAKLLRCYLGTEILEPKDLQTKVLGNGMTIRKVDQVAEFLESCFSLLDKSSEEYCGLKLGAEAVARFVKYFGPEHAENVMASIANEMLYLRERLHLFTKSDKFVFRYTFYFIVQVISERENLVQVTDVRDFFDRIINNVIECRFE
jgi:hypothetical protein